MSDKKKKANKKPKNIVLQVQNGKHSMADFFGPNKKVGKSNG